MMKFIFFKLARLVGCLFLCVLHHQVCAAEQSGLPYIDQKTKEFFVHGKPLLMLGGELANSSAADETYLKNLWPRLSKLNLNTAVVPVYWELMEPEEGKYDFNLVDLAIREARAHQMKIVFFWFGSWKNSMSCYTPAWVKKNSEKYSLVQNKLGEKQAILSPFSAQNLAIDIRAYSALLNHIKQVDSKENTVLMMQVENEIGMLPDARDYSAAANIAFSQTVPDALIQYLLNTKYSDAVTAAWIKNGKKLKGNWVETFGDSIATEEFFIAWYFARYADEVAEAGKKVYALPTYVNAALNRPFVAPGKYPSGGPLPHLISIWKAAGPHIDLLSPDFYNPDFRLWNDQYYREDNPLFIPEIHFDAGNAAKVYYAFGHYQAIGFSPFTIDHENSADPLLAKAYKHLSGLSEIIHRAKAEQSAQSIKKIDGVWLTKERAEMVLNFGQTRITLKHEYTLSWKADAKNDQWPESGGIVIQLAENEFLIAGTGLVATFSDEENKSILGIESIWEGEYIASKQSSKTQPTSNSRESVQWKKGRLLNGDESHQGRHLRITYGSFESQRVFLYKY